MPAGSEHPDTLASASGHAGSRFFVNGGGVFRDGEHRLTGAIFADPCPVLSHCTLRPTTWRTLASRALQRERAQHIAPLLSSDHAPRHSRAQGPLALQKRFLGSPALLKMSLRLPPTVWQYCHSNTIGATFPHGYTWLGPVAHEE